MRTLDRIFKLSRIFKRFVFLMRYCSYDVYGDGVPGWDGYYDFAGRCIAFRADDGSVIWLHEVR